MKFTRKYGAGALVLAGLVGSGGAAADLQEADSSKEVAANKAGYEEIFVEGRNAKRGTTLGPWSGRSLQDTPYSISVVPEELIENLQASVADQVFKFNPVTQFHWPQTQNDNPYVFLRGFQTTTFARNGITRQKWNYAHGTTMEETARVEVLTGLSGFLYGGGNVGGMVNFVTKRPTEERLNCITLGNTGGENLLAHGDFGGQFDRAGKFGYRVNVVAQDGETPIENLNHERQFISGFFDWQVTDKLVLELDLSRREYFLEGRNAYWYMADGVARPDADELDTSVSWGQRWTNQDIDSERVGINAYWEITEGINFRAGFLDEYNERRGAHASNTIQADNTYNQEIYNSENAPQTIYGEGYFAFLDFAFNTGAIGHNLTLGYQLSKSIWDLYPDGNTNTAGNPAFEGLSLDGPTYIEEPEWGSHGTQPVYQAYDQRTETISLGDDISLNEQWSLLVGISDSRIYYKNFNAQGEETANYDDRELTPTLSLVYKPKANITSYFSYIESLEQGGVASENYGERLVINANEVMSPLVSDQLELGLKATLGQTLLTAAVFEIDKPLEYYEVIDETSAEFVQAGRQVHSGIELTATGELMSGLTVVGGITLLDARVEKNEQNPELEGKTPRGVSEQMYKLYLEYDIASVPGLTVNGGASYTGDFYGDNENTDRIDGYALLDLGARYEMSLAKKPLTLRLNINNLTDNHYWANQYFLGDPRAIVFSANVKL